MKEINATYVGANENYATIEEFMNSPREDLAVVRLLVKDGFIYCSVANMITKDAYEFKIKPIQHSKETIEKLKNLAVVYEKTDSMNYIFQITLDRELKDKGFEALETLASKIIIAG